jgi:hypothetical protein
MSDIKILDDQKSELIRPMALCTVASMVMGLALTWRSPASPASRPASASRRDGKTRLSHLFSASDSDSL